MSILAIIPARSGSKGIPGKNIRHFGGRPLFVRSLEAARSASSVSRVIVSTDSVEYREHPEVAEGECPFLRPADISGDSASSESALLHALEWLARNEDYRPELLVFLQCTSPLTLPEDIDGCVQTLIDQEADCCFSVTPTHAFLWKSGDGGALGVNHDPSFRPRRQDREPEYRETGAVYVMRTAGFLETRHRFFGKTVFHVVPEERSWEIDGEADWQVCEALSRYTAGKLESSRLPDCPRAIVFDFDGVFTDNLVAVDESGRESVTCNRSDGLGLAELQRRRPGIELLILSKERNRVVQARAEKLGIPVMQGIDRKVEVLARWLAERGIEWKDLIYVGNDINDLECLNRAGCGVAVADAYPEAREAADVILSRSGGRGAVRELVDMLFPAR